MRSERTTVPSVLSNPIGLALVALGLLLVTAVVSLLSR